MAESMSGGSDRIVNTDNQLERSWKGRKGQAKMVRQLIRKLPPPGIKGGHVLPKLWSMAYPVRTRTMEERQLFLEMLPETKGNGQKYPASSLFLPSHLCQFPPLLKLSANQLAKSMSDVTCRIQPPIILNRAGE